MLQRCHPKSGLFGRISDLKLLPSVLGLHGKAMKSTTNRPKRRWLQFSLRTLLILVTVSAVPLCWVAWKLQQRQRERATIAWVEKMGGRVNFKAVQETSWWQKWTAKWIGVNVRRIYLPNTQVSDLSPLAELKKLESLVLNNTQVSDLSPLAELKNLKKLRLRNTQVSDLSPLAELKKLE